MLISFVLALYFNFAELPGWSDWQRLLAGVALTTFGWMTVTLLTPATDRKTLQRFVQLVGPGGVGWSRIAREAREEGVDLLSGKRDEKLPAQLLCVLLSSVSVYSLLFAIGYGLYGNLALFGVLATVAVTSALATARVWQSSRA